MERTRDGERNRRGDKRDEQVGERRGRGKWRTEGRERRGQRENVLESRTTMDKGLKSYTNRETVQTPSSSYMDEGP